MRKALIILTFQSASLTCFADQLETAAKQLTANYKNQMEQSDRSDKELKNFFNKKQPSSNGIAAAMDACQSTVKKTTPQLTGMQGLVYCSCIQDALREFRGINKKQLMICVDAVNRTKKK